MGGIADIVTQVDKSKFWAGTKFRATGSKFRAVGSKFRAAGSNFRAGKTEFAWRKWRKMLGRIGTQITRKYAHNLFIDVYTINLYSIPN